MIKQNFPPPRRTKGEFLRTTYQRGPDRGGEAQNSELYYHAPPRSRGTRRDIDLNMRTQERKGVRAAANNDMGDHGCGEKVAPRARAPSLSSSNARHLFSPPPPPYLRLSSAEERQKGTSEKLTRGDILQEMLHYRVPLTLLGGETAHLARGRGGHPEAGFGVIRKKDVFAVR